MVTFLMSVFCVTLSYAQQGEKSKRAPEERAAKRIEMMKKSLGLTDEQAAKVQEAQKQLFEDMKQIRAKGEGNREEMKTKRDAFEAQLKTILTSEQYQKFQDQRKNMRKEMHKKMHKGCQGGCQKGQNTKEAAGV